MAYYSQFANGEEREFVATPQGKHLPPIKFSKPDLNYPSGTNTHATKKSCDTGQLKSR